MGPSLALPKLLARFPLAWNRTGQPQLNPGNPHLPR